MPQGPNQRWSLDFVSDALSDGRRFRILALVDDFTRERLCLVADTSLSGRRVVRELDAIAARCGWPAVCVSDNGTEFTSMAIPRLIGTTPITEADVPAMAKGILCDLADRGPQLSRQHITGSSRIPCNAGCSPAGNTDRLEEL